MPDKKYIEKKFLLVDDHTLIRSGLKSILKEIYSNAVFHESADGTDVLEKLISTRYDLIIMDIQMPNSESLGHIQYIHIHYPLIPVLIYSMTPENIYGLKVLKAGAKGFVSKESSMEELLRAIDLALNGKTYLSQDIAELLSELPSKKTTTPFANLSPRELQIVSLLLAGNTVTNISKILHLQNSTVATHKARIFQKLKVNNLLELKELSSIYL